MLRSVSLLVLIVNDLVTIVDWTCSFYIERKVKILELEIDFDN